MILFLLSISILHFTYIVVSRVQYALHNESDMYNVMWVAIIMLLSGQEVTKNHVFPFYVVQIE